MQENIERMKKKGQDVGEREMQEGKGRIEEEISQRTGGEREGSPEPSEGQPQEKRRRSNE